MTPEQWAKVNDLFHGALERAAGERRAWLMAETGGDPELMREVEALIAAHEREPSFLDAPAVLADPPLSAAAALSGRQIGPYVVSREIGRGGMGVVYLAHDTRLGRDVAIKALPRDLPSDERRRERLRREARAAAALAHPNIAIIYALEEIGDELYLVSEYVRGHTLREELTAHGPLPAARLVETAIEITRAIGAAHAEGIIHRDLKPDNVMRTASGAIKILDFGLARALVSWADEDLTPTLTRSGTLLGTPAYMAPEQIRGSRVDTRADLFSVGVTFYELATGVHPFDAGAIGLTLHRILTESPLTFAQRGVRAPAGLWEIVERCLQKEPEARYDSAASLLADLGRLQITLNSPPSAEAPTRISLPSAGLSSPGQGDGASRQVATPFGSRETETSPHSSEWWWQFHQLAVSVFLSALIVPAWQVWEWVPNETWRGVLRLGTLVVVIVNVSLRLHLWFLSRFDPAGLLDQRARSALVIRAADTGFSLALLTGALSIMAGHARIGALFLGLGIVYAVVFLMIEPATTRAAFRER